MNTTLHDFKLADTMLAEMMRKHRFFPKIATPDGFNSEALTEENFPLTFGLYHGLQEVYKTNEELTARKILAEEGFLGFSSPKLREGQKTAQTNMYGGGLIIYDVCPFEKLAENMPELSGDFSGVNFGKFSEDLFFKINRTPLRHCNGLEGLGRHANLATQIWEELKALKANPPKFLFLAETTFVPSSKHSMDSLQEILSPVVKYPKAVAYLAYLHAVKTDMVFNRFVLCSANHERHELFSKFATGKNSARFYPQMSRVYDHKVNIAFVV